MEEIEMTPASVQSVQDKLQTMYDELPDHEKSVLEVLLAHAAEGSASSEGNAGGERSIIIVSGRPGSLRVPLDPGVLVSLNPQPLPPHESFTAEQLD